MFQDSHLANPGLKLPTQPFRSRGGEEAQGVGPFCFRKVLSEWLP